MIGPCLWSFTHSDVRLAVVCSASQYRLAPQDGTETKCGMEKTPRSEGLQLTGEGQALANCGGDLPDRNFGSLSRTQK